MVERVKAWPLGVQIAAAALAVNTARYILVFLEADGLSVWPLVKAVLLVVGAVSTGLVLTGGGAFIAHAVAMARGHWLKRGLLVVAWLALLVATVIILAPHVVHGLRASSLADVVPAPLDWLWAGVAVCAVEVLAAAAILAHGLTTEAQAEQAAARAAERRAQRVARPEPAQQVDDGTAETVPAGVWHDVNARKRARLQDDQARMIDFYRANPTASLGDAAAHVGRGKSTVKRWRDELAAEGVLVLNGAVHVVDQ